MESGSIRAKPQRMAFDNKAIDLKRREA